MINRSFIMPKFGAHSRVKLMTCHPDLVRLMEAVVENYDCTILDGARTEADQADKVKRGLSKTMDSKHVVSDERPLSDAVDAAPFPTVWPDESDRQYDTKKYVHEVGRFYHFAGYVKAKAEELGIKIRWGGDWDKDLDFTDQKFDDLDHFERVE